MTALAFAPDGRSVVVGSQAGAYEFTWPDLTRGRKLASTLTRVDAAAFSPNGQLLAVGGGTPSERGAVELLAWPGGALRQVLAGHTDTVAAIAWLDDTSLVTTSLDQELDLWRLGQAEPVRRFQGHSRGVTAAAVLGTPPLLVSGSLDQNLRVWDPATGRLVRSLHNHTREIHQLAVRPGSQPLPMLASVAEDRTVRLWQPTIGRMVRFAQLDAIPLAVGWTSDGGHVAVACSDGHLRLIDPDTVETVRDVAAVDGWAFALAMHPTDGSALVGGRNGQLRRVALRTPSTEP